MLQCTTAFEEARLLHPGDSGWFAIMRKLGNGQVMSQMHPMAHLDIVTRAIERASDVYLSQSSFSAKKRRITSFANVRAAWVDIDCYNIRRDPDETLIQEIVARCVEVGLPKPTYVVKSGRGLYAKWIFREEVGPSNLPVWNALQRSLCATFKAIGADVRARDVARVLRTVGSINSKAPDEPVHLAWCNTDLVDFDHLCLAASEVRLAPDAKEKIEQVGRLSQLRTADRARRELADLLPSITHLDHLDRYAQTREPILMASQERSLRALHWKRFTDLRQLAHLRGGIQRGSRNNFMFWMMVSLTNCGVVTRQNFFDELADLSRTISSDDYQPLQDGSMGSLFDRIGKQTAQGKDAVYAPSNAKLIDLLEITEQEQQHLSTLISPFEKRRRADARCPGRQQKREELQKAHRLAMDLLEKGNPAPQVAEQAGVDRRQVYRWQQAARLKQHCPKATDRKGRAIPMRQRQFDKGHIVGRVADMLAKKLGGTQICLELGLSESAWYRICKSIRRCGLRPDQLPGHASGASHELKEPLLGEQGDQATKDLQAEPLATTATTAVPTAPEAPSTSRKATSILSRLAQARASSHLQQEQLLARQQARLISQQATALIQKAHALGREADDMQSGDDLRVTLDRIKQRLHSRGIPFKATHPEHDPRHAHTVHAAPSSLGSQDAVLQSPAAMKAVLDLRQQARQARHEAEQLFSKLRGPGTTLLDVAPKIAENQAITVCNHVMSGTVSQTVQVMQQGLNGAGVHHGGASTTGRRHPSGPPGVPEKGPGGEAPQDAAQCRRAGGGGGGGISDHNLFASIFAQLEQRRQPGAGQHDPWELLAGPDPGGTAS